ncbi:MAG TPA: IS3 family transposase [Kiritimatiellia bacterium]|nr:IS3 family transposase [Kiritimatiellia bacterium]HMP00768.1 IS3 family transposase [Kiritimatiellia bacterium]
MIQRMAADYTVRELCHAYDVSRHGYDQWRHRQGHDRQAGDNRLVVEIKAIFKKSRCSYGVPKMTQALRKKGYVVNHKRVARLMQTHGIQGRKRRAYKPRTTDSNHNGPIAPNRLAQVKHQLTGPDQAWVSDITYIPTREGWLYLATVMDLFSRRIVGWSCSTSLRSELVNLAFVRALRHRQPSPGLISHSDRGVQYAAASHRRLLEAYGVVQSMSRKGNCYDNAAAEAFFSLLKAETLPESGSFKSRKEAFAELFKYIETEYNRTRIHSSLGYVSPVDFEIQYAKLHEIA